MSSLHVIGQGSCAFCVQICKATGLVWRTVSNKSFLFLFLYSLFFARMDVFMPLVINVIHYNSSFLDEDIITGIVRWALKKHCSQCDLYTESSFTAHMHSHKAIALVPQTMAAVIVSRSLSASQSSTPLQKCWKNVLPNTCWKEMQNIM